MTLRWGILGAARFARSDMGPAIHAARGNELVCVGSRSGRGFDWHPSLRVHPRYEDVLADPEVDAVYVPLPNSLHVEWAERAAEAGLHVLVEKPVATDLAGVDRLIVARARTGRLIAEAFMIVHHPQWALVREWLAAGRIGRLRLVDATFAFSNVDPADIRNRPETAGGALGDVGVYAFGGARFATGSEPVDLWARIEREGGVDTLARVGARMEGSGHAFDYRGTVSTRLAPWQEVTFHGEGGLLRMSAPFNPGGFGEATVNLETAEGRETRRWPRFNQYVAQVEAFARATRGEDYACPLEFSRGTQAMIELALAADPA